MRVAKYSKDFILDCTLLYDMDLHLQYMTAFWPKYLTVNNYKIYMLIFIDTPNVLQTFSRPLYRISPTISDGW